MGLIAWIKSLFEQPETSFDKLERRLLARTEDLAMTSKISWRNYVDATSLTATYDGSSAGTVQPLGNLADVTLASVWRYMGPFAFEPEPLKLQWQGFSASIGVVSLLAPVCFKSGQGKRPFQWKVLVYQVAFPTVTLVHESDVLEFFPGVGVDLSTYPIPVHQHYLLPPGLVGNRVVVEFVADNLTDAADYFQLGGLWVGPVLDISVEKGVEIAVLEDGTMEASQGRQGYPEERPRYRSLSISFTAIPQALAFGTPATPIDLQQIEYFVGFSKPLMFFPFTGPGYGSQELHRTGLYCNRNKSQSSAMTKLSGSNWSQSWQLTELL